MWNQGCDADVHWVQGPHARADEQLRALVNWRVGAQRLDNLFNFLFARFDPLPVLKL